MEIAKRIQLIIDEHGLTASAFADRIGIQRSGLSHIFSGRNKPSLDLVMKIIEEFPGVQIEWLLWGKEPMSVSLTPESDNSPADTNVNNNKSSPKNNDYVTDVIGKRKELGGVSVVTNVTSKERNTQETGEVEETAEPERIAEEHLTSKKVREEPVHRTGVEPQADIKGVIVLRKNGTFSHYSPE